METSTTLFKELEMVGNAVFSEDRQHRYLLKRIWNPEKPFAMVVGLNPSTANENQNDPTIRRLIGPTGLLHRNGYGGLYMVNLFTMVTPKPKQLIHDQTPATAMTWWTTSAFQCQAVVFAWGAFDIPYGRDQAAKQLFPDALCFGHNANGSPKHPLYLSGHCKMRRFDDPNDIGERGYSWNPVV